MCVFSAWNGAGIYIEVFSVKYQQSLKECEEQWNELSKMVKLTHSENIQVFPSSDVKDSVKTE